MNFIDRRFLAVSLVVNGIANSPADSPIHGSQYIVGSSPTGAFAGATAGHIAYYNGSAWSFSAPKSGSLEVLNADTLEILRFNGSAWVRVANLGGGNSNGSSSPVITVKAVGTAASTVPEDYFGVHIFINQGSNYDSVIKPLSSGASTFTLEDNDAFLSTSDNKIYTYSEDTHKFTASDIEDGQVIFNSDFHEMAFYVYDYNSETLTCLGSVLNILPVDTILDALSYTYDEASNIKAAHQTEGYSFAAEDTVNEILKVYTYSGGAWAETSHSVGFRFAAKALLDETNSKPRVYEYISRYGSSFTESFSYTQLLPGDTFLNKAENSLYVYNGSTLLKVNPQSAAGSSYVPPAPVLDIVPTGSALPASASTGDTFLKTDDAKIYTATAANTWNSGTATANGARYASSTDHKIYSSDGSAFSGSTLQAGEAFLNKADNFIYVFDGSTFIKGSNNSVPVIVNETHSLTAAEVTAKGFSLSNSIKQGEENNVLLFVSGVAQYAGIDFTASGSSISWTGKALDNVGLAAGDSFLVRYSRA